MTTLNIRIDEQIKARAGRTLSLLGFDMSTAVKIFLHQVITERGLPFAPTRNMAAIKNRWDRQKVAAVKHGKTYKSAKDALRDLL